MKDCQHASIRSFKKKQKDIFVITLSKASKSAGHILKDKHDDKQANFALKHLLMFGLFLIQN